MTKRLLETVPKGFDPLPRGLGYTDTLQPIYRKVAGDSAVFGLVVGPQHSNTMGLCHGGVLMTLADIAAATGANLAHGAVSGSPTINLSINFIACARQGQWLQAEAEHVSVKRRFGFCSGGIYNGEEVVARFSATVYFPDHNGMLKDASVTDLLSQ
ncbi:MAG: PaaI family thioesterase [Halioglobus sp.]|nr:PaaI family thioesterase [Halioglobus sp.]